MTDSPWVPPDYRILYYEFDPASRPKERPLPAWVREQIHFRHERQGLTIPEICDEYGISRTSAYYICSGLHVRTAEWMDTLPVRILQGGKANGLPITGEHPHGREE